MIVTRVTENMFVSNCSMQSNVRINVHLLIYRVCNSPQCKDKVHVKIKSKIYICLKARIL